MVNMEKGSCAICGVQEGTLVVEGPDRLYGGSQRYRVLCCGSCGLLFLSPRPAVEEMHAFYPESYKENVPVSAQDPALIRRILRSHGLRRRVDVILDGRSPGRLLDIGCATGILLDAVRSRGWETEGIEPSAAACSYARDQLGLRVHQGTLSSVRLDPGSYDVVVMWNVVEHLHDPIADLVEVKRLLKPDGRLVLTTPNAQATDRAVFGEYWALWELPRHLYFFDVRTVSLALAKAGLKVKRVRCFNGGWYSFITSVQYWWHGRRGRHVDPGALWDTDLKWQALRAIMAPYLSLNDRLGRGPQLTVWAAPC